MMTSLMLKLVHSASATLSLSPSAVCADARLCAVKVIIYYSVPFSAPKINHDGCYENF